VRPIFESATLVVTAAGGEDRSDEGGIRSWRLPGNPPVASSRPRPSGTEDRSGRRRPWATAPRLRIVLAALLAVPMLNYVASVTSLDALGLGGTTRLIVLSANGAALAAAFAIVVTLAPRHEA